MINQVITIFLLGKTNQGYFSVGGGGVYAEDLCGGGGLWTHVILKMSAKMWVKSFT